MNKEKVNFSCTADFGDNHPRLKLMKLKARLSFWDTLIHIDKRTSLQDFSMKIQKEKRNHE